MREFPSFLATLVLAMICSTVTADPLPDTQPLKWEGDIASRLVEACDAFLLRQLEASILRRESHWHRDISSAKAYEKSIADKRQQFARILGVRDERTAFTGLTIQATTVRPGKIAESDETVAFAISWPAFGDVHGEGVLLVPRHGQPRATVIVLPDASTIPEQLCGLADGIPRQSQLPRYLAGQGCRVIVPALISRAMSKRNNRANLTHREFIFRPAFVVGRHLIGYEIQKVLALVDWLRLTEGSGHRLAIVGYGEGGMLAFYASAIDPRIDVTYVSGFFGTRETVWQQPLSRNVFGLLREYGDAQVAAMIAPRALTIALTKHPEVTLPGEGGSPAVVESPDVDSARAEFERARKWTETLNISSDDGSAESPDWTVRVSTDTNFSEVSRNDILSMLRIGRDAAAISPWQRHTEDFQAEARLRRQIHELDRHNQALMNESPYVRKAFLKDLDTSSLAAYAESVDTYREMFRRDVIGDFELPLGAFHARTRKSWETEKWTGYEVVLDVAEGLFAYGVLLLPTDLCGSEDQRPVVVCQHGLEGRPTDVFMDDHPAYHDYAARLAEQGFITFAPQNIYIFQDRFRTLQRKANPLGKTLFSIIVPQHQQIVNWLKTLPNVDGDRIAFYGLSYGGKSAMRIPALVTDYCLSICSADFNEWVRKNASTRLPFSYVWTGEYEIFEWDLGSTFNYAEMAALIAPRPFMVERGHFDGVGWDEWVAYEYAKVRHLYAAQLHIADRTEIEFFDGPHTINGQGTFRFLQHHLKWPARK